jgi:hypothetical protein
MAARHFENAQLGIFPDSLISSTLLMSGYAAPLRLSLPQHAEPQRAEPGNRATDRPPLAEVDVNNIGRCIRWAFAIEGGVAALIFAGWAVCRFWL